MQPQDTDSNAWGTDTPSITDLSGISLDSSSAWGTDPFINDSNQAMHYHPGSSYFENNDPFPRRAGKKQLFADNPTHAGPSQPGPSSQPFYNQTQPSEPAYGLENRTTMSGLKRKREESLEPMEPWLADQNPPNPMSILDDDPRPGLSYSKHLVPKFPFC